MKTSDVYLSAALLALGYKLESVDRKDPRHMVFEFVDVVDRSKWSNIQKAINTSNINDVEREWANRNLMVNAFDFAEAIKRMKSLIHSS